MLMGMPAAYAADAQSDARLKIQIGDFLQSSTDSVQSINGTDYLPLRDLLECYGIKISWAHEADKKIILTTSANQKYELIFAEDKQELLLDYTAHPYIMVDGTVYLPLAFYQDVLNCAVEYDQASKTLVVDESRPPADVDANEWKSYRELRNIPAYQKTEKVKKEAAATYTYYQEGYASWYGKAFQNRRTSSGEAFDANKLTAAHRDLPFGTKVRVTALYNGKSVIVTINDRGPSRGDRVIDLSQAAARAIGLESKGVGLVKIEVVK